MASFLPESVSLLIHSSEEEKASIFMQQLILGVQMHLCSYMKTVLYIIEHQRNIDYTCEK